jgi:hypothetical protein
MDIVSSSHHLKPYFMAGEKRPETSCMVHSHIIRMSQRVAPIVCIGYILLCLHSVPVFGDDELIYQAAFSDVSLIPNSSPSVDTDFVPFSQKSSVIAMIQQLKGIPPESDPLERNMNIEQLVAEVQSFDATSVNLDENGNYIPQFPAKAYAQGIFGTSFSESGVERYPNGTIISSYAVSDSARVAAYVTQFVKKYHYVSGIDLCANGGC